MTRRHAAGRGLAAVALALVGAACADGSDAEPGALITTTTSAPSSTTTTAPTPGSATALGPEDRPAVLIAPSEITEPAPMVVLLHGYGSSAAAQDAYLGVTAQSAGRGLYVLLPNGTQGRGRPFWDAKDPACCNFTGTPVDDVTYLSDLIEEAIARQPVDATRVYVLGHSNGGFMAYRLACERSDLLAGIAVLAGSLSPDTPCEPDQPVSVLHLHGTEDETISYGGGQTVASFPGAVAVVAEWAERDGCDATAVPAPRVDLDSSLAGAETAIVGYAGCDEGTAVQLDTIEGGRHIPALTHAAVGTQVLDWLLARQR